MYYKNEILNWPRDRIYVKGYGLLSFAKRLSNKYGQKLLDSAKKSTADAIKTASKRAIQKTAETTGDLIDNKIADKITNVSKISSNNNNNNHNNNDDVELTTHKKRYISPEERQQIINELRLVPKKIVDELMLILKIYKSHKKDNKLLIN